jgi:hypothetical protein
VRHEAEDDILPTSASSGANTRRGSAASNGLQPQAKGKKTNKSRGKAFRVEHLRTFGLKLTQRESETGKIASAACRFCFHFGREPRADASEAAAVGKTGKYKTKATIVKQFSTPWRTDAFTQHLKLAHNKKWAEYTELDATARMHSLKVAHVFLTRTRSTRTWKKALGQCSSGSPRTL